MVGEGISALQMLQLYFGNGSLMLLFAVALVYLWAKEKNKSFKILLIYFSLGLLVLFFFTPLLLFVQKIGEGEIYYRLLWLLPIGIVIPYAVAKFASAWKKKWLKYTVVTLVCVYVAIGGNCVYNAPQLSKAQNAYQIPQEVIDICDAIVVEGREVKAVFPHELLQYVRQYSAFVVLTYGYDSIVERWGLNHPLEEEMRKEVSDSVVLASLARETHTHYIVLHKHHQVKGDLEEQEFKLFFTTENYVVYLDENAYLGLD